MDVHDHAKKLAKESASNFYYSFLFLPKPKREAMYAVYAFCRLCDDIVDGHLPADEAAKELQRFREELDLSYQGRATHPILVRVGEVAKRYGIPKRYFGELIDGMEMDLMKQRYTTFEELREYCYRAASVVGLICIEIFSYKNPTTKVYAENLGIAFQLINILRDLVPDLKRGRIYLPLEDLSRFRYREEDLMAQVYNEAFIELMRFEAGRARSYFQKAEAALPREDRRSMVAAEIMRAIYAKLLDEIERASYNVFQQRISLPRPLRLRLAFTAWLRNALLR
ncbi:MAG: presqualene diphosphate synthase HpnD [Candidatus Methylomirabilales bacterium]